MANEESGFDAGEFYDTGVEEAGLKPEEAVTDSPDEDDSTNVSSQVSEEEAVEKSETEKKATEKETKPAEKQSPSAEEVTAAIESTEDTEQEVESVVAALLPEQQEPGTEQPKPGFEPGKYVPVGDHIKLRERAQAAEQERDDLQQQLEASTTQTGGAKPGAEAEKSPLEKFVDENPDEDIVPAKVQLEERKFQEARQQKAQAAKEKAEQNERAEQEKQYRTKEAIKAISTKALKSETEVRKANADFDAVVKPIVTANILTDAERVEFLRDANPAQKLYEICKAKTEALRGVLGAPATTSKTKTTQEEAPTTEEVATEEEADLTDDEQIYKEVKDLFHPNEEEEE